MSQRGTGKQQRQGHGVGFTARTCKYTCSRPSSSGRATALGSQHARASTPAADRAAAAGPRRWVHSTHVQVHLQHIKQAYTVSIMPAVHQYSTVYAVSVASMHQSTFRAHHHYMYIIRTISVHYSQWQSSAISDQPAVRSMQGNARSTATCPAGLLQPPSARDCNGHARTDCERAQL